MPTGQPPSWGPTTKRRRPTNVGSSKTSNTRGPDRFYLFRTTEYTNVMNRTLEINDVARKKLTMPDSYFSEDQVDEYQDSNLMQEQLYFELGDSVRGR